MQYWVYRLPSTVVSLTLQNESEIADALEASNVPREDIFITSKIGPTQVILSTWVMHSSSCCGVTSLLKFIWQRCA